MVSLMSGAGTPEARWLPFLAGLQLPALDLSTVPERAVVVAPHPDDEVLALGGLLCLLGWLGTRVEVLAVTDGEASNPGGSVSPVALAALRAAETEAALAALGLPAGALRLGRPDGGQDALEQPVVEALRLEPGTWLIGPWAGDGHPDHAAVGRACVRVAERDGARLLEYPVWAWHWATPASAELPWTRAVRLDLSADVATAKAGAIAEFRSQITALGPLRQDAPVLSRHVLDRFARPYEVAFT